MVDEGTVKDITICLILLIFEISSECFENLKFTDEICIAIRLIIGCVLNIIEISYNFIADNKLYNDKSIVSQNGYKDLIIALITLVIIILITSIVYLALAIRNRKIPSFDSCVKIQSISKFGLVKFGFILFLIFKFLSIFVSVMLCINGNYLLSSDDSYTGAFFLCYGIVDIILTLASFWIELIRFVIVDVLCCIININQVEDNKQSETTEEKEEDYFAESCSSLCYSLCFCIPCIAAIPAMVFSKKAQKYYKNRDLKHARKYSKISKYLNMSARVLFTLTVFTFGILFTIILSVDFIHPKNCLEISNLFYTYKNRTGPNRISLNGNTSDTSVYCEANGWTKIMYKINNTKIFNASLSSYENGFGRADVLTYPDEQNYWFGLDNLRLILIQKNTSLRIEFSNSVDNYEFIEFSYFNIKNASQFYALELGEEMNRSTQALSGFSSYHNGMNFTTFDSDRDKNPLVNCAIKWSAGWWFNDCFRICPTCFNVSYCDSSNNLFSFKIVKMMIR
jgi:hypothetical protein